MKAKLPVHCYLTESHLNLFINFFLPSIKERVEITEYFDPTLKGGTFMSIDWVRAEIEKADYINHLLQKNDQRFLFTDVDIVFFRPVLEEIYAMSEGYDILGSRDQLQVNCGFIVLQPSARLRMMWGEILSGMKAGKFDHEQQGMDYLLKSRGYPEIKARYLPDNYMIGNQQNKPVNAAIFHANYFTTPDAKSVALKDALVRFK